MDATTNALNWFEIPVIDMGRAKHFYQVIFSIHMDESEIGGMTMAMFPYASGSGKVAGALVKSDMHKPSNQGVIIYLNANPNLDSVLNKVEAQGGRVTVGKTQITAEIGYMAFFTDTEGNTIALHSQE